jgi:hypothetical protein
VYARGHLLPDRRTWRCLAGAEEKGETRVDHVVDEVVAEKEHLERDLDRNDGKQDLEPAHEADRPLEAPDLGRMLLVYFLAGARKGRISDRPPDVARREVRPKVVALAEADLEVDRLGLDALVLENLEGVMIDV